MNLDSCINNNNNDNTEHQILNHNSIISQSQSVCSGNINVLNPDSCTNNNNNNSNNNTDDLILNHSIFSNNINFIQEGQKKICAFVSLARVLDHFGHVETANLIRIKQEEFIQSFDITTFQTNSNETIIKKRKQGKKRKRTLDEIPKPNNS